MEANEGYSSDKIYYEERISKSCLDQISHSYTPKLSSLMLSLMLVNGWHASLPLKVFRTESQGEIPIRGEGCNTLGVCHQLSSGFELQHDKFSGNQELYFKLVSGDKGVGINSLRMSPNLNLDNTPCFYVDPFQRYAWVMWKVPLFMCLTSISICNDYWKSFMKFGAKKSHELISYIFA